MKKELSVSHEMVTCGVCGRTILKGERTEPFLAPDGTEHLVCELCVRRAEGAGWLRASAGGGFPAVPPRSEPRRSLIGRLRRPRPENGPAGTEVGDLPGGDRRREHWGEEETAGYGYPGSASPAGAEAEELSHGYEPEPAPTAEELAAEGRVARRERRARRPLRDPRHVRAIPTGSDAKVERALELFNASEFQRTVAGLMRTLGDPWVTAVPLEDSPSEVTVVVAWELSWYQYRVDLGDADDAVALERKGHEVAELEEPLRLWNAAAAPDGALEPRAPAA